MKRATTGAKSWYAASAHASSPRASLQGDVRCDVAVLGGGFTGLSAAIELAQAGRSVVLLEAEHVGFGASGRNGGQVIFGYSCGEAKIEAQVGREAARALFDWSVEGVRLIHDRCAAFDIDCDWREGHAHVAIKPRHVRELKDWQAELAEVYQYPLHWWDTEQLRAQLPSERYIGALYDPHSGHLHPLNYALGLARAAEGLGVRIFEHSPVLKVERGARPRLHTAGGVVDCEFAVLAGNALLGDLVPELHARVMPVGSYIGATAPLGAERAQALIRNGMAVADTNWAVDYFRLSRDHRLLFGGRASYSAMPGPNLRGVMRRRMSAVFPQLRDEDFEYLWGGFIDISLSRAPHWGRLDSNLYFAQGFSGHGVAASGLAGRVLAEAIRGQSERLDVYSRLRHLPFPGGRWFRMPLLVAAMAWYKLRDAWW